MISRGVGAFIVISLVHSLAQGLPLFHAAGSPVPITENAILNDAGVESFRVSADDPTMTKHSVNGLAPPTDGRFDYPPRVIDSRGDFVGTAFMTALYTQLALVFAGGRFCGLTVPLGGLIGPAGCVIIVGLVGFVSAGSMFAIGTYRGGRIRYAERLTEWCDRQALFDMRNRQYEELCVSRRDARHQRL